MKTDIFQQLFDKRVGQIKPGLKRIRVALDKLNLSRMMEKTS